MKYVPQQSRVVHLYQPRPMTPIERWAQFNKYTYDVASAMFQQFWALMLISNPPLLYITAAMAAPLPQEAPEPTQTIFVA